MKEIKENDLGPGQKLCMAVLIVGLFFLLLYTHERGQMKRVPSNGEWLERAQEECLEIGDTAEYVIGRGETVVFFQCLKNGEVVE